jgi:hypothetical protein
MAYNLEISYFNSFWVKKTNNQWTQSQYGNPGHGNISKIPNWPGIPYKTYGSTAATRYLNYVSTSQMSSIPNQRPDVNYSPDTYDLTLNWIIEESRIRGAFNGDSTDYGVKAYLLDDQYTAVTRRNNVIYSGLFNSKTNVNETNVFSSAQSITFAAPEQYGSIQKLYSEDTKLLFFQENKVSRAMVNKNILYTTEGRGAPVSSQNLVIGEITPFVGEYGISRNPYSFAKFGRRKYFTDKNRNVVLRLSDNGLTPISDYGMADFFRDRLSEIDDNLYQNIVTRTILASQSPSWPYGAVQTISPGQPYITIGNPGGDVGDLFSGVPIGASVLINEIDTGCYVKSVGLTGATEGRVQLTDLVPFDISALSAPYQAKFITYEKDRVIGAYNTYTGKYVLSMQKRDGEYNTLSFDEKVLGWVSFYDYKPYNAKSLFNRFYTTNQTNLWMHNAENVLRNSFYGEEPITSSIEFIFNAQPNIVKTFKTVNYEGTNGWEVTSMISDQTGALAANGGFENFEDETAVIKSYGEGLYIEDGIQYRAGFDLKENRYVANVINNTPAQPGEIIIGDQASGIKGYFTTLKLTTDATTDLGGTKELFAVGSEYVMSSY